MCMEILPPSLALGGDPVVNPPVLGAAFFSMVSSARMLLTEPFRRQAASITATALPCRRRDRGCAGIPRRCPLRSTHLPCRPQVRTNRSRAAVWQNKKGGMNSPLLFALWLRLLLRRSSRSGSYFFLLRCFSCGFLRRLSSTHGDRGGHSSCHPSPCTSP